MDDTVDAFRLFLADQIGGDRVPQKVAFRLTSMPVLAGLLLYRLDTIRLEAEEPALHAQIRDYLSNDVWLGFVIRTNNDSNSDMLMDPEYVSRARAHLLSACGPQGWPSRRPQPEPSGQRSFLVRGML